MGKVKRQHFVPQFYLKYFSANEKQLFVYDKIENKTFTSDIASIASAKFFYDWEKLDTLAGKQYLEDKFEKIETKIGSVLKNLIANIHSGNFLGLNPQDKSNLAEFIWYQMIRNIEGRTVLSQLGEILAKQLSTEEYPEIEISNPKVDHIKMLLPEDISKHVSVLTSRIWIFTKNITSSNFYTSDNPVVHYVHEEIHFLARETFIPISPKLGILILPRKYFQEFESLEDKILDLEDESNIQFYNVLQTSQSTRQIYSIDEDFYYAQRLVLANPQIADLNRRRLI